MAKSLVAVAVLVPVAAVVAAWVWRVASSRPASWSRQEVRLAAAGALLVVPGAVALGAVEGVGTGVLGLLLWGVLAGVFFGAVRLDTDEEPDGDTRLLIDISCLAFAGVTVFFSFVSFGYVFLPAASLLVVALRYAHMRRARRVLRQRRS